MNRRMLKGVRAPLCIMELWICLCWLLPIAAELAVRRLMPIWQEWQGVILVSGYALNRLLVAPAHIGRAACCRKISVRFSKPTAHTCEIHDLRDVNIEKTLLKDFFAAYLHPITCFKKQLGWDALRLCMYTPSVFVGTLLAVLGGRAQQFEQQVLLAAGGCLIALAGMLTAWVLLRRLQTALYSGVSWFEAWKQTRKVTGKIVSAQLRYIPLICLPFSLYRFVAQVSILQILQNKPTISKKHKSSQIFHTRVIRET